MYNLKNKAAYYNTNPDKTNQRIMKKNSRIAYSSHAYLAAFFVTTQDKVVSI